MLIAEAGESPGLKVQRQWSAVLVRHVVRWRTEATDIATHQESDSQAGHLLETAVLAQKEGEGGGGGGGSLASLPENCILSKDGHYHRLIMLRWYKSSWHPLKLNMSSLKTA